MAEQVDRNIWELLKGVQTNKNSEEAEESMSLEDSHNNNDNPSPQDHGLPEEIINNPNNETTDDSETEEKTGLNDEDVIDEEDGEEVAAPSKSGHKGSRARRKQSIESNMVLPPLNALRTKFKLANGISSKDSVMEQGPEVVTSRKAPAVGSYGVSGSPKNLFDRVTRDYKFPKQTYQKPSCVQELSRSSASRVIEFSSPLDLSKVTRTFQAFKDGDGNKAGGDASKSQCDGPLDLTVRKRASQTGSENGSSSDLPTKKKCQVIPQKLKCSSKNVSSALSNKKTVRSESPNYNASADLQPKSNIVPHSVSSPWCHAGNRASPVTVPAVVTHQRPWVQSPAEQSWHQETSVDVSRSSRKDTLYPHAQVVHMRGKQFKVSPVRPQIQGKPVVMISSQSPSATSLGEVAESKGHVHKGVTLPIRVPQRTTFSKGVQVKPSAVVPPNTNSTCLTKGNVESIERRDTSVSVDMESDRMLSELQDSVHRGRDLVNGNNDTASPVPHSQGSINVNSEAFASSKSNANKSTTHLNKSGHSEIDSSRSIQCSETLGTQSQKPSHLYVDIPEPNVPHSKTSVFTSSKRSHMRLPVQAPRTPRKGKSSSPRKRLPKGPLEDRSPPLLINAKTGQKSNTCAQVTNPLHSPEMPILSPRPKSSPENESSEKPSDIYPPSLPEECQSSTTVSGISPNLTSKVKKGIKSGSTSDLPSLSNESEALDSSLSKNMLASLKANATKVCGIIDDAKKGKPPLMVARKSTCGLRQAMKSTSGKYRNLHGLNSSKGMKKGKAVHRRKSEDLLEKGAIVAMGRRQHKPNPRYINADFDNDYDVPRNPPIQGKKTSEYRSQASDSSDSGRSDDVEVQKKYLSVAKLSAFMPTRSADLSPVSVSVDVHSSPRSSSLSRNSSPRAKGSPYNWISGTHFFRSLGLTEAEENQETNSSSGSVSSSKTRSATPLQEKTGGTAEDWREELHDFKKNSLRMPAKLIYVPKSDPPHLQENLEILKGKNYSQKDDKPKNNEEDEEKEIRQKHVSKKAKKKRDVQSDSRSIQLDTKQFSIEFARTFGKKAEEPNDSSSECSLKIENKLVDYKKQLEKRLKEIEEVCRKLDLSTQHSPSVADNSHGSSKDKATTSILMGQTCNQRLFKPLVDSRKDKISPLIERLEKAVFAPVLLPSLPDLSVMESQVHSTPLTSSCSLQNEPCQNSSQSHNPECSRKPDSPSCETDKSHSQNTCNLKHNQPQTKEVLNEEQSVQNSDKPVKVKKKKKKKLKLNQDKNTTTEDLSKGTKENQSEIYETLKNNQTQNKEITEGKSKKNKHTKETQTKEKLESKILASKKNTSGEITQETLTNEVSESKCLPCKKSNASAKSSSETKVSESSTSKSSSTKKNKSSNKNKENCSKKSSAEMKQKVGGSSTEAVALKKRSKSPEGTSEQSLTHQPGCSKKSAKKELLKSKKLKGIKKSKKSKKNKSKYAEQDELHRKKKRRSMLDELANSDGYVAEKRFKTCENLYADPSQLGREDRALQRAIMYITEMELKTNTRASTAPTTRSVPTTTNTQEKAKKLMKNALKRSRASKAPSGKKPFKDFEPQILPSRTRQQTEALFGEKSSAASQTTNSKQNDKEKPHNETDKEKPHNETEKEKPHNETEKEKEKVKEKSLDLYDFVDDEEEKETSLPVLTPMLKKFKKKSVHQNESKSIDIKSYEKEIDPNDAPLESKPIAGTSSAVNKSSWCSGVVKRAKGIARGDHKHKSKKTTDAIANMKTKKKSSKPKHRKSGSPRRKSGSPGKAQGYNISLAWQDDYEEDVALSDLELEDDLLGSSEPVAEEPIPSTTTMDIVPFIPAKQPDADVMSTSETESQRHIPPEVKKLAKNMNTGETVLHRAARLGYEEVALWVTENHYCDLNAKDFAGFAPLHETCVMGHVNIGKILISHGAEVNVSSTNGIRPIHDAVENEHYELVRLFLSCGADPTLTSYTGRTLISMGRSQEMKNFLKGYMFDLNGNLEGEKEEQYWWDFKPCYESQEFRFKHKPPVTQKSSERKSEDNEDEEEEDEDDEEEEDEEEGFDVLADPPSDSECSDMEMEFDMSDVPHVESYYITVDKRKGPSNYLILDDILQKLCLDRREFFDRHPRIKPHTVRTKLLREASFLPGVLVAPNIIHAETERRGAIEVIQLNQDIKTILGVDTEKVPMHVNEDKVTVKRISNISEGGGVECVPAKKKKGSPSSATVCPAPKKKSPIPSKSSLQKNIKSPKKMEEDLKKKGVEEVKGQRQYVKVSSLSSSAKPVNSYNDAKITHIHSQNASGHFFPHTNSQNIMPPVTPERNIPASYPDSNAAIYPPSFLPGAQQIHAGPNSKYPYQPPHSQVFSSPSPYLPPSTPLLSTTPLPPHTPLPPNTPIPPTSLAGTNELFSVPPSPLRYGQTDLSSNSQILQCSPVKSSLPMPHIAPHFSHSSPTNGLPCSPYQSPLARTRMYPEESLRDRLQSPCPPAELTHTYSSMSSPRPMPLLQPAPQETSEPLLENRYTSVLPSTSALNYAGSVFNPLQEALSSPPPPQHPSYLPYHSSDTSCHNYTSYGPSNGGSLSNRNFTTPAGGYTGFQGPSLASSIDIYSQTQRLVPQSDSSSGPSLTFLGISPQGYSAFGGSSLNLARPSSYHPSNESPCRLKIDQVLSRGEAAKSYGQEVLQSPPKPSLYSRFDSLQ